MARLLRSYANRPDVIVLALPRGGVPVGYEIARALGVPFDVFVVRKLGVPGHVELALGAIAPGGVRHLNDDVIDALGIPGEVIDEVVERESHELDRRERLYRGDRSAGDVMGRTVILVDDGLATGASMRVAIEAVRESGAAAIIVAVPVGAAETCATLSRYARVVCARTPYPFYGVGVWYERFDQLSDDDVRSYLTPQDESDAG